LLALLARARLDDFKCYVGLSEPFDENGTHGSGRCQHTALHEAALLELWPLKRKAQAGL
jgi:hypothetical protein